MKGVKNMGEKKKGRPKKNKEIEIEKTNLCAMRKAIQARLRRSKIEYKYDLLQSRLYDGEGFYVNHIEKVNQIKKIWGWDIHWAYGGALLDNVFPLTTEINDNKTELGLVLVEFTKIKRRYEDFHYTIFRKKFEIYKINNKNKYQLLLTNLDFEIFRDMYESDFVVLVEKYYAKVGKLPFNEIINKYYKLKKKAKNNKTMFEAAFYGIFAMKILKAYEKNKLRNQDIYIKAITDTGLTLNDQEFEDLRNCQVVIATFQTAYLRYREWQNFKKYKNSVVYMNTDSIYTQDPVDIEDSPELGHYGRCRDGEYVYWIRRNAYVVVDHDQVIESVIGGVLNGGDITIDKLNTLRTGQSIRCKTKNKNNEIIEGELKPKFLLYDYE